MSKSTATTPASATPAPVSMPAFSPRSLLQLLWERARPHMSVQELRWLAEQVPEFNCYYAQQMECVLEGVGCLISTDGTGMAGTLQSHHDVPDLLFSQATHMSLIGGMSRIGSDAASLLLYPSS
ncbi:MAG: hypothetical protein KA751_12765 [Comamonas sp.]|nr:hypothetical protein [Comamonas sp.]